MKQKTLQYFHVWWVDFVKLTRVVLFRIQWYRNSICLSSASVYKDHHIWSTFSCFLFIYYLLLCLINFPSVKISLCCHWDWRFVILLCFTMKPALMYSESWNKLTSNGCQLLRVTIATVNKRRPTYFREQDVRQIGRIVRGYNTATATLWRDCGMGGDYGWLRALVFRKLVI